MLQTGPLPRQRQGQPRYVDGGSPTKRGYTGQIDEPDLGLTFFQSRFYDLR